MIEVNQEQAIEIIKSGINVFLTGNAGSGKTYLIKDFVNKSTKNIALTATTGIAALNIGGDTIHRFLGLGISTRPEDAAKIISAWEKKKKSTKPWDKEAWNTLKNLETLIIDEVSMLRRDQFELIDVVLSSVLDNSLPFGGVQIILVGDFFQLPPVITPQDKTAFIDLRSPYCFQSGLWHHAKFANVCLNTNYRQSDPKFLDILNKIRIGECDNDTNDLMSTRLEQKFNSDIQPIKLFPHKKDVAEENMQCLKALNIDVYLSEAEYEGKQYEVDILKKDCPAEEKLFFCKGAQIMMLTNDMENRWVNGSMGIIIDIDPVRIKLSDGRIITPALFTWERTVHQTKSKKVERKVVAKLTQYPFKLAYATTIHKSQSLTLDFVEIDLSKCFTPGQAYTALSRVKTLEGLTLSGWDRKSIIVDENIKKFYKLI